MVQLSYCIREERITRLSEKISLFRCVVKGCSSISEQYHWPVHAQNSCRNCSVLSDYSTIRHKLVFLGPAFVRFFTAIIWHIHQTVPVFMCNMCGVHLHFVQILCCRQKIDCNEFGGSKYAFCDSLYPSLCTLTCMKKCLVIPVKSVKSVKSGSSRHSIWRS